MSLPILLDQDHASDLEEGRIAALQAAGLDHESARRFLAHPYVRLDLLDAVRAEESPDGWNLTFGSDDAWAKYWFGRNASEDFTYDNLAHALRESLTPEADQPPFRLGTRYLSGLAWYGLKVTVRGLTRDQVHSHGRSIERSIDRTIKSYNFTSAWAGHNSELSCFGKIQWQVVFAPSDGGPEQAFPR